MNRIGIATLLAALLATAALLLVVRGPFPQPPRDAKPLARVPDSSAPERAVAPLPPVAIDAEGFHSATRDERISQAKKILDDHDPAEAYRQIAALLAHFDPDGERLALEELIKLLLDRMADDPASFALPHDDLKAPKSEVARLLSARLLFEAHAKGWYLEPFSEEFLTACESSESPGVRQTLIEYIAELPEFEPAEVLIESVLLDSLSPADIESGTLALEALIFQQKTIRAALAEGLPLHPGVEGKYSSVDEVPDSTAFAKKLLVDTALNRKQTHDTLYPILDLLVHLRARSEIDFVLKRFRQADLIRVVEDAQRRESTAPMKRGTPSDR